MKKILFLIICSLNLISSGCTVTHIANPVVMKEIDSKNICIVESSSVRGEFLTAYKSALADKGFSVKVVDHGSDPASYPLASTYLGKWSWDFVPYMAYAEIVVYKNGVKVGNALYKAPRAGFALTTKIYEPTDKVIAKMVDQLFPDVRCEKLSPRQ